MLKFHTNIKTETFKFNLYEIKSKPIGMCTDIPIVNSQPIRSPFHSEFPQQGSSFLRNVHFDDYPPTACKI